eukprot:ANDGO_08238.mRNA.1 hypothetical protein SDRG_07375
MVFRAPDYERADVPLNTPNSMNAVDASFSAKPSRRRTVISFAIAAVIVGTVAALVTLYFVFEAPNKNSSSLQPTSSENIDFYTIQLAFTNVRWFGFDLRLMAWNHSVPGPALETRPGHTLKVLVQNRLPPNRLWPGYFGSCWNSSLAAVDPMNRGFLNPHGFRTTNLHTHGVQTNVEGNGDNVFTHIEPGEDFLYDFPIPIDHPAGYFYVHPHKHGSVDVQMSNGMVMDLRIRGDIDDFLDAYREFSYAYSFVRVANSTVSPGYLDSDPLPFVCPAQGGYVGESRLPHYVFALMNDIPIGYTTNSWQNSVMNDSAIPVVDVMPGETVRIRMLINIQFQAQLRFSPAVGLDAFVFAVDGITQAEPWSWKDGFLFAPNASGLTAGAGLALGPGNRIEFLFRSNISNQVFELQDNGNNNPITILKFRTGGLPRKEDDPGIPSTFPTTSRLPVISSAEVSRTMWMNMSLAQKSNKTLIREVGSLTGEIYYVNQDILQMNVVNYVSTLGTAEEWLLFVDDDWSHPFHLHANPFYVVSVRDLSGKEWLERPYWTDDIVVPARYVVTARVRFIQHTGILMYHCHITSHEDQGMGGLVKVVSIA